MFFKLNPEPCAQFGRKTLYGGELTDVPPQVYRLHLEFNTWPSTEIVGVNTIFIGTDDLIAKFRFFEPKVTGVVFEEVMTTATPEFRKENPGKELPPYKWFKICGQARVDDFGMSPEHELIISARIFELLG
jgi:hypothetical protein